MVGATEGAADTHGGNVYDEPTASVQRPTVELAASSGPPAKPVLPFGDDAGPATAPLPVLPAAVRAPLFAQAPRGAPTGQPQPQTLRLPPYFIVLALVLVAIVAFLAAGLATWLVVREVR
jgi:hypothetical protein